ncbi:hypothetical protein MF406_14325 [Georgenia sp. TF02-10]|nr:hypothetical protein [Georgenia sp. TF02-10]UNX54108.1 hypothetical protein MF406_14325 [Georgenia sp. TF02-10]
MADDERTGGDPGDISPVLFPHQRDIVQWAVEGGRLFDLLDAEAGAA